MRTREEIEGAAGGYSYGDTKFEANFLNNQALQLEVLLDIRDQNDIMIQFYRDAYGIRGPKL